MSGQQVGNSLLGQLNEESDALLLSLANRYQYQLKDFPQAIACLQLYLASRDSQEIRARISELEGRTTP